MPENVRTNLWEASEIDDKQAFENVRNSKKILELIEKYKQVTDAFSANYDVINKEWKEYLFSCVLEGKAKEYDTLAQKDGSWKNIENYLVDINEKLQFQDNGVKPLYNHFNQGSVTEEELYEISKIKKLLTANENLGKNGYIIDQGNLIKSNLKTKYEGTLKENTVEGLKELAILMKDEPFISLKKEFETYNEFLRKHKVLEEYQTHIKEFHKSYAQILFMDERKTYQTASKNETTDPNIIMKVVYGAAKLFRLDKLWSKNETNDGVQNSKKNMTSAQEILNTILSDMQDLNTENTTRAVHEQFQLIGTYLIDIYKNMCFGLAIEKHIARSSCFIRIPSAKANDDSKKKECDDLENQASFSTTNCKYIFPMKGVSDHLINERILNASIIKVEKSDETGFISGLHTQVDSQRVDMSEYHEYDIVNSQDILNQAFYEDYIEGFKKIESVLSVAFTDLLTLMKENMNVLDDAFYSRGKFAKKENEVGNDKFYLFPETEDDFMMRSIERGQKLHQEELKAKNARPTEEKVVSSFTAEERQAMMREIERGQKLHQEELKAKNARPTEEKIEKALSNLEEDFSMDQNSDFLISSIEYISSYLFGHA
ncbi:hypothetical protein RFI_22299 [Reticulomyxa filosa]|uniref:Uncharacterized protein n=1 Tax=Reticulomyxa filosa TaxID=46433 RepID=X6MPP3_RETFI|nr:hypothetical protein RFI_22299 [Reticulomyxa filosa]|eukprot:ETO15065.1 hypothetical protein RFI_22299 [Reticulomyxa filosa]